MEPLQRVIVSFFLVFAVLAGMALPANAQFGLGFGIGGWNWNNGFGTFFGINLRPGFHDSSPASIPSPPSKAAYPTTVNRFGTVEGYVTLRVTCPGSSRQACPLPTERVQNVLIRAVPDNTSAAWVATQADSQGHYHLALWPGSYTLQAMIAQLPDQRPTVRPFIIQPGQSLRVDLPIDVVAQSYP